MKKHKKCYKPKEEKRSKSPSKMIQIKFTTEPISDEKNYDVLSKDDQDTIARIYHRLRYHPETIKSDEDEHFLTLNRLREKYTNFPTIWNYITMGYTILGLNDKVRESVFETYNKFPNYLFAMTGVANVYLQEGQPEKVLEIFGGAKCLPEMYPDREVFHVTEGRAFHHTIAYYYCVKGEVELAKNQLKLLEMVSEMMEFENDPLVLHIRFEIIKLPGYSGNSAFALFKQLLKM